MGRSLQINKMKWMAVAISAIAIFFVFPGEARADECSLEFGNPACCLKGGCDGVNGCSSAAECNDNDPCTNNSCVDIMGMGQCIYEPIPGCGKCIENTEVCDGIDNDCDGDVDEDLTQSCSNACGNGTETCQLGHWVNCSAPQPQIEICDNIDNDCDGEIDEGVTNTCTNYSNCSTYQTCDTCSLAPQEICNGIDDDCDGQADEGFLITSQFCDGNDADICANGVYECLEDHSGVECVETIHKVEICNYEDDDCDGLTDEGLTNTCTNYSNCSTYQTCDTCSLAPQEICNGIDDDCDGQTDEGVLNACGGCGPVPQEICNGIDDDCDGQTDEGVLNACGGCGSVPVEVCDGVDNDCDGLTDEGFDLGSSCSESQCVTGIMICDPGDNSKTICQETNKSDGTSCGDDNVCNGEETCQGGFCQPTGDPLSCDDDNQCTNDSCNPVAGCQYENNTLSCEDGNACTERDSCLNGTCQPGVPVMCNDGNECTVGSCSASGECVYEPIDGCCVIDSDCNDGNACNGNETCQNNSCVAGMPLTCDDGNICTIDSCAPAAGCVYDAMAADGDACEDGDLCTENDACMAIDGGGSGPVNVVGVGGGAPEVSSWYDNFNSLDITVDSSGISHIAMMPASKTRIKCGGVNNYGVHMWRTKDGYDAECVISNEMQDTPFSPSTVSTFYHNDYLYYAYGYQPSWSWPTYLMVLRKHKPADGAWANASWEKVMDKVEVYKHGNWYPPQNIALAVDDNGKLFVSATIGKFGKWVAYYDYDGDGHITSDERVFDGFEQINYPGLVSGRFAGLGGSMTVFETKQVPGTSRFAVFSHTLDPNNGLPEFSYVELDIGSSGQGGDGSLVNEFVGTDELGSQMRFASFDFDPLNNNRATVVYTNRMAVAGYDQNSWLGFAVQPEIGDDPQPEIGEAWQFGTIDYSKLREYNGVTFDIASDGAWKIVVGTLTGSAYILTKDPSGQWSHELIPYIVGSNTVKSVLFADKVLTVGERPSSGEFTINYFTERDESVGYCTSGEPKVFDDGNVCTNDSCDPATGEGVFEPNNSSCDDNSLCTENDTCSDGGCGGTPLTCDDSNACTIDSCNSASGCVASPININDSDACTIDSCDPVSGESHQAMSCDDGNACNGTETCNSTTGCVAGTPLTCDDGNSCTLNDSCDPGAGCMFGEDTTNICGTCGDAPDADLDGIADCEDNCPDVANTGQADFDDNGVGDVCDPGCGNGVTDEGETCDNGASNSDTTPDACRTNCLLFSCGDSVMDSNESCDDGNANNDDGCRNNCTVPTCGDGVLDIGEICDDGANNGSIDYCNATCSGPTPYCGDEVVDVVLGEVCDGNDLDGKTCELLGHKGGGELSCSAECLFDETPCLDSLCGDGVQDAGEDCDGAEGVPENYRCTDACALEYIPYCGDGILDAGEDCDGTADCRADCTLMVCGDGVVDPGEACDKGVANSNTGECTASCQIAMCGDNFVWDGHEGCDEGFLNSDDVADSCRADCTAARCGDGVVDSTETCDDSDEYNGTEDFCNATCTDDYKYCGDGVKDQPNDQGVVEVCDLLDGVPEGQECKLNCSGLESYCGDGVIDEGETCDGQEDCRADCTLIACGDGILDPGEECDGTVINETCESLGLAGGPISCTANCEIDGCIPRECEPVGMVFPCTISNEFGSCPGTKTCQADYTYGPDPDLCTGQEAVAEVCNGIDDNCNTLIDEGVKNACGTCGPAPQEVCNGIDDDCDTEIDEGVKNVCGTCGAVPTEICNGIDDDCDTEIDEGVKNACGACGPVPEETCDGIDNNCNGLVDDGIQSRSCDGVCGPGTETCSAGAWTCDAKEPVDEICGDDIDNDCDGEIDEDCEETLDLPYGVSDIFDLPETRAFYLPFKDPAGAFVYGEGEKQLLTVYGEDGILIYNMEYIRGLFAAKKDLQAKSMGNKIPDPKLIEGTFVGYGRIGKESEGDLVYYNDEDKIIIVTNFMNQIRSGQPLVLSEIDVPYVANCSDYKVDAAVEDSNGDGIDDIKINVDCDGAEHEVVFLNNTTNMGQLEAVNAEDVEFVEAAGMSKGIYVMGIGGLGVEIDEKSVIQVFDDEYIKSFVTDNFAVDDKNIAVGALLSIRMGSLDIHSADDVDVLPMPIEKENYLGCSLIDDICNNKDEGEYFIEPMGLNGVTLKDYGGPDLMAIFRKVKTAGVLQVKRGDAADSEMAAMFLIPNKNEPPIVNIEDLGGKFHADAHDPTNDKLTYKWGCKDSKDASCDKLFAALDGEYAEFVDDPNIFKAVDSGPAAVFPISLTVKVEDAGGMGAENVIEVEEWPSEAKKMGQAKEQDVADSGSYSMFGGGCGLDISGIGSRGTSLASAIIFIISIAVPMFVRRRKQKRY